MRIASVSLRDRAAIAFDWLCAGGLMALLLTYLAALAFVVKMFVEPLVPFLMIVALFVGTIMACTTTRRHGLGALSGVLMCAVACFTPDLSQFSRSLISCAGMMVWMASVFLCMMYKPGPRTTRWQ